jgi:Glycosyl transferase family 90
MPISRRLFGSTHPSCQDETNKIPTRTSLIVKNITAGGVKNEDDDRNKKKIVFSLIVFRRFQQGNYSSILIFIATILVMFIYVLNHEKPKPVTDFHSKQKYPLSQHDYTLQDFYQPEIITSNENLSFPSTCPLQVHTYQIQNSKVRWVPGSYSYMTRGMSMHCLLARAAKRLGPNFDLSLRIGLADMDLESPLSFQPAAIEQAMTAQLQNASHIPPILFPDSTFESFPEVHDYNLQHTIHQVQQAAIRYGLPGTSQWETKRKTKLLWRGSRFGALREKMMNSTSPLLDVQAIAYNLTTEGFRLSSNNQISRKEFCSHRFLLHMNGEYNDRYSSSVKWKLLCGSLVFVPTTPLFVEWWNYQLWEPYVHYIPYSNLTDLLYHVQYYHQHLQEAAIIAKNGMELVQAAFRILPQWIDTTLVRYANVTRELPQTECISFVLEGSSSSNDTDVEDMEATNANLQYKSLEELQTRYGPKVCG